MQREKPDPSMSWPVVVATGHTYRLHWGEGIDFMEMKFDVSPLWTEDDMNVKLMTNFTDVRMSINMTDRAGEQIANETFLKPDNELISGDNVIYNQTEVREFWWVVNGKDYENRSTLRMEGFRCIINCDLEAIDEEVEIADGPLPWSEADSWESGAVPVEGEDVEIPPGAWIELDLEDTPRLKSLTINGRLTF